MINFSQVNISTTPQHHISTSHGAQFPMANRINAKPFPGRLIVREDPSASTTFQYTASKLSTRKNV